MDGRSRLGPLQERQFALLYAGQAVSLLGDALVPIALAFAVIPSSAFACWSRSGLTVAGISPVAAGRKNASAAP